VACAPESTRSGDKGKLVKIMITRNELLSRRADILDVARRHGASDVRVIRSVARGDQTPELDVELVVRFEADRSLMDHGLLIEELQELLGVKVDMVSEGASAAASTNGVAREALRL
jgi:predicted nucleotidyltransferase